MLDKVALSIASKIQTLPYRHVTKIRAIIFKAEKRMPLRCIKAVRGVMQPFIVAIEAHNVVLYLTFYPISP
jgi:hypothetical protein